jgi:hypothetical protein
MRQRVSDVLDTENRFSGRMEVEVIARVQEDVAPHQVGWMYSRRHAATSPAARVISRRTLAKCALRAESTRAMRTASVRMDLMDLGSSAIAGAAGWVKSGMMRDILFSNFRIKARTANAGRFLLRVRR